MTLAERIDEMVHIFGTLRNLAEMLEIDAGYLSRLRSGEKTDPSDDVLMRLGLRRVVTYERIFPKRPAVATPLNRRTKSA